MHSHFHPIIHEYFLKIQEKESINTVSFIYASLLPWHIHIYTSKHTLSWYHVEFITLLISASLRKWTPPLTFPIVALNLESSLLIFLKKIHIVVIQEFFLPTANLIVKYNLKGF